MYFLFSLSEKQSLKEFMSRKGNAITAEEFVDENGQNCITIICYDDLYNITVNDFTQGKDEEFYLHKSSRLSIEELVLKKDLKHLMQEILNEYNSIHNKKQEKS